MTYISINFFVLVAAIFAVYFLLPLRFRWISLLVGSVIFYYLASGNGLWIVLATAVASWLFGLWLEKSKSGSRRMQRLVLVLAIVCVVAPWFWTRYIEILLEDLLEWDNAIAWIAPMGISYYTLQIISYLADIYLGKNRPERNPFRYMLYILYFPQILQGPIPRYGRLSGPLYEGHRFDEDHFRRGVLLIVWGFFLKLMIADKAYALVDLVFSDYRQYRGMYVLVGGILYCIQLYADFMACVSISRGVSRIFGIELENNFRQPYFAVSISEFWKRWHISLSMWLRDYVYIPLGGSRKGKAEKYCNLLVTFLVSGFWHGAGLQYILWGMMHACYQIIQDWDAPVMRRLESRLTGDERIWLHVRRIWTFLLFMFSQIMFRAQNWRVALEMLQSILTVHNFWIFTDDSLLNMGLDWKDWFVLLLSIVVLWLVGKWKEEGRDIAGRVLALPLLLRWGCYLILFFGIMTFGTYGMGFDAQAFIYGGF